MNNKKGFFGQDKSKNFQMEKLQEYHQQEAPLLNEKPKNKFSIKKIFMIALVVLIVISFGAWGVFDFVLTYTSGRGYIAKVGSHKISINDFNREYKTQIAKLTTQYGESEQLNAITNSQEFRNIVLSDIINKALVVQEFKGNGLALSKASLIKLVKEDVNFQNGGEFDSQKFNQYLKITGQNEESYLRQKEYEIAKDIILNPAISHYHDFTKLSQIVLQANNQTREVKLFYFTPSLVNQSNDAISDTEIENFYNTNKEQFLVSEKRYADYIDIYDAVASNIKISDAEMQGFYNTKIKSRYYGQETRSFYSALFANQKQATDALAKIKAGESYEKIVSQALKKDINQMKFENVKQGDFDKQISDVVFSLVPSGVSQIVKTDLGFYIIKLISKQSNSAPAFDKIKTQIKDSIILEKACQKTREIYNVAEDFSIKNPSIEDLKNQIPFKFSSVKFDKSQIKSFIESAVFKASPNSSYPVFISDEQNPASCRYYIFKITKTENAYYKPLQEVKIQIIDVIKKQKQQKALFEVASKFTTSSSTSPEQAVQIVTKTLLAKSSDAKFYPQAIVGEVFSLNSDLTSPKKTKPVEFNDGYVVALFVSKHNPNLNPEQNKEELAKLKTKLEQTFLANNFKLFNEALMQKHKVKIYDKSFTMLS